MSSRRVLGSTANHAYLGFASLERLSALCRPPWKTQIQRAVTVARGFHKGRPFTPPPPSCSCSCRRHVHQSSSAASSSSSSSTHSCRHDNSHHHNHHQHHHTEKPATWTIAPPEPPTTHPRPRDCRSSSTATADAEGNTNTLPEQLRALMRLVTHPVVVCTASTTATAPTATGSRMQKSRAAMTISSFTSLALRPAPIVTFNVATPSRTLDAVATSRRFNVHVVAGDVAGARVADWFSRGLCGGHLRHRSSSGGGGDALFDDEALAGACGCTVVGEEEGEEEGPPLLRGPGILYVLRCRLLDDEPARGLVTVRDRVIVLGEVVEIVGGRQDDDSFSCGNSNSEEGEEEEERFGLVYADRRYRQLGNTLLKGR